MTIEDDDGVTFTDPPTPEKLAQLRDKHIRMYEARLLHGAAPVNVSETSRLLKIWQGMANKIFTTLTEEERGEVIDAIESGER